MNETKPKIYTVLPDEIRNFHPHGQWVFDTPGLVINFVCDVEDHIPVVEPWARKLAEFQRGPAEFLEFESPHLPGICYLTRAAAEHIILTHGAWSQKVMARGRNVIDHDSGLPVIRKVN